MGNSSLTKKVNIELLLQNKTLEEIEEYELN